MNNKKLRMNNLLALVITIFSCCAITGGFAGTVHYVSQSIGDDSLDGKAPSVGTPHGPWKTLRKASQISYAEGDQLLLKSGDSWTDGLVLKGGGTSVNPAMVSSYGIGPKPVIDRQDSVMAHMKRCIHLDGNGRGWKILNLELANAARGIEAWAAGTNRSFLWLENLDVHGCKFGERFSKTSGDQNNMQNGVRIGGSLGKATIRSCKFSDNFVGLWAGVPSDITVCLFAHMEWTGLWYVGARGGIISSNKFMHNCDRYVWCGVSASALAGVSDCVVEYNEFGETQVVDGAVDGEDLDFEAGCDNVILRHNLFHESGGPASMLYNSASHNSPNKHILIHDNVFFHAAMNPSSKTYECTFLLSDGNSGTITNNRIYCRPGVPVYGGSDCPGVATAGNLELKIEEEPREINHARPAVFSASSNRASAANAGDDNPATGWTAAGRTGEWLQLEFKTQRRLDYFVVQQTRGSLINNFVLQCWEDAAWKDIFTSYSEMGPRKYMPTRRISTQRVRLLIHSTAGGSPSISELACFDTQEKER